MQLQILNFELKYVSTDWMHDRCHVKFHGHSLLIRPETIVHNLHLRLYGVPLNSNNSIFTNSIISEN